MPPQQLGRVLSGAYTHKHVHSIVGCLTTYELGHAWRSRQHLQCY
jgi:hypothetical protein